MKDLFIPTSDGESIHIVPEELLLEIAPCEDGSSLVAYTQTIKTPLSIEELRREISKKQSSKIIWHTESPQPSKAKPSPTRSSTRKPKDGLQG